MATIARLRWRFDRESSRGADLELSNSATSLPLDAPSTRAAIAETAYHDPRYCIFFLISPATFCVAYLLRKYAVHRPNRHTLAAADYVSSASHAIPHMQLRRYHGAISVED